MKSNEFTSIWALSLGLAGKYPPPIPKSSGVSKKKVAILDYGMFVSHIGDLKKMKNTQQYCLAQPQLLFWIILESKVFQLPTPEFVHLFGNILVVVTWLKCLAQNFEPS